MVTRGRCRFRVCTIQGKTAIETGPGIGFRLVVVVSRLWRGVPSRSIFLQTALVGADIRVRPYQIDLLAIRSNTESGCMRAGRCDAAPRHVSGTGPETTVWLCALTRDGSSGFGIRRGVGWPQAGGVRPQAETRERPRSRPERREWIGGRACLEHSEWVDHSTTKSTSLRFAPNATVIPSAVEG